jgi:hypothetical protein
VPRSRRFNDSSVTDVFRQAMGNVIARRALYVAEVCAIGAESEKACLPRPCALPVRLAASTIEGPSHRTFQAP